MTRVRAVLSCFVFVCVVPGTVVGLVPLWITGWRRSESFLDATILQVLGVGLIVSGASLLLHAVFRFALEGLGTPAPVAPTTHLVVGGLYRFVRNPMYLAVAATVLGQALLLGQVSLLWYGAAVCALQAGFVHFYEEPELRSRFGAQYDAYCAAVPAWLPRLSPWRPEPSG